MELNSFKQFLYLKEIAKNKFARFREKEGISQEEIDRAHADFEKLQALRKIPQTFNIQAKDFEGKPLTFKVLRDLLDVKLKEVEKEAQEKLSKQEKKKTVKDDYNLIEETPEYLVIEPLSNPCVFEWAPKSGSGDSVWCIGWKKQKEYFDKYLKEDGAKYFLIIDKKENPDQAKYAFVPCKDNLERSQYRDYTNSYNVKSAVRNNLFAKLPKTEAAIKNHLGEMALTLNYDTFTEMSRPDSYPVRYRVGVCKDTDLSIPIPENDMLLGILDDKGKIIIPIKYSYIGSDEGFFIIKSNATPDSTNCKAVVGWNGIFLTPPDTYYSLVNVCSDKIIILGVSNKKGITTYGAINSQGETIIPMEYISIDYDNGILSATMRDGKQKIINSKGKEIIYDHDKYTDVGSFYTAGEYTIARAKVASTDPDKRDILVIIDDEGNTLISENNNYIEIGTFRVRGTEPTAVVGVINENDTNRRTNTLYGVINLKNEVIIPMIYKIIELSTTNYYYVTLEGGSSNDLLGAYNYEGEKILPPLYHGFRKITEMPNTFRIYNHDINGTRKWGVFKDGVELIPPKYYYLEYESFSKEFTVGIDNLKDGDTRADVSYGVIDLAGKEVIPCEYYSIDILDAKHSILYKEDKRGNKKGALYNKETKTFLTKFKYDTIHSFDDNDMAKVSAADDDKYGYINREGKEVIPCIYQLIENFSGREFTVAKRINENKKSAFGLVDRSGKELTPFVYGWIANVSTKLIKVRNLEDKRGYINQQGQEVIPCKYDNLDSFNGLEEQLQWVSMRIGDRYGKVNMKGEEKWDNET
jgi:hypothetical protein